MSDLTKIASIMIEAAKEDVIRTGSLQKRLGWYHRLVRRLIKEAGCTNNEACDLACDLEKKIKAEG